MLPYKWLSLSPIIGRCLHSKETSMWSILYYLMRLPLTTWNNSSVSIMQLPLTTTMHVLALNHYTFSLSTKTLKWKNVAHVLLACKQAAVCRVHQVTSLSSQKLVIVTKGPVQSSYRAWQTRPSAPSQGTGGLRNQSLKGGRTPCCGRGWVTCRTPRWAIKWLISVLHYGLADQRVAI